jgi:hypothetical protein
MRAITNTRRKAATTMITPKTNLRGEPRPLVHEASGRRAGCCSGLAALAFARVARFARSARR